MCSLKSNEDFSLRSGGEDIHFANWVTLEEINSMPERFEPWSLLAVSLVFDGGF